MGAAQVIGYGGQPNRRLTRSAVPVKVHRPIAATHQQIEIPVGIDVRRATEGGSKLVAKDPAFVLLPFVTLAV